MSKKHMGSSIDDFIKEEGIFEEAQAQAVKEVVAWQLAEAMKKKNISKNKMATLLKTSRTQVDRILDPKNDITLGSLQRAAATGGRNVDSPEAHVGVRMAPERGVGQAHFNRPLLSSFHTGRQGKVERIPL